MLGLVRVVTSSEPFVLGYLLLTCTTRFLRLAFFVVTRLSDQGSTTSRTFQARKRPRKDTVARAYYQLNVGNYGAEDEYLWRMIWLIIYVLAFARQLIEWTARSLDGPGPFARQLTGPAHSLNRRLGFGPARLSLPLQRNV